MKGKSIVPRQSAAFFINLLFYVSRTRDIVVHNTCAVLSFLSNGLPLSFFGVEKVSKVVLQYFYFRKGKKAALPLLFVFA